MRVEPPVLHGAVDLGLAQRLLVRSVAAASVDEAVQMTARKVRPFAMNQGKAKIFKVR